MRQLAEKLPFSHHITSCIVCRISGAIMDENNPPMVLPNGHVYSQHVRNPLYIILLTLRLCGTWRAPTMGK
jgi:hypothetical protein